MVKVRLPRKVIVVFFGRGLLSGLLSGKKEFCDPIHRTRFRLDFFMAFAGLPSL